MSEVFVVHTPFMGIDFPSGVFQNLEDAMQCVLKIRRDLEGIDEKIDVYQYTIGAMYDESAPVLVHSSMN